VKIHIVQKGDTLWKIAQKYGVDFEELKQMNTQLSNPDMIMPGMKIKVPSSSGTVKKEMLTAPKEMPKAQHPFIQKEQPIMPVQKEAPKPVYTPKMPQPIIPEIDVNNYYMVNMANMSLQNQQVQQPTPQLPPAPTNILPTQMEEESPESVESPETLTLPEQTLPITGGQPMPMPLPASLPMHHCYPISPVLPGSGMPCPPQQMPMSPMYGVPQTLPMQQAPIQQPVTLPAQMGPVQQPMMFGEMDESSSSSSDMNVMMNPMPSPMQTAPMMAPVPMMQQPTFVQGVQDDCGCGGPTPQPYQLQQGYMMPTTGGQPLSGVNPYQGVPTAPYGVAPMFGPETAPMYGHDMTPMYGQPQTAPMYGPQTAPMYGPQTSLMTGGGQPYMGPGWQPMTGGQFPQPGYPMYQANPYGPVVPNGTQMMNRFTDLNEDEDSE